MSFPGRSLYHHLQTTNSRWYTRNQYGLTPDDYEFVGDKSFNVKGKSTLDKIKKGAKGVALDKLKESLLKKIKNPNFKSEDLSSNEVYLIYKSLFQLNKQFALQAWLFFSCLIFQPVALMNLMIHAIPPQQLFFHFQKLVL